MIQRRSMMRAMFAAGVMVTLNGCETATTYQPAASATANGYRETQIEPGRWRVSSRGNELTSRDTVETYLLYRSAELTVQSGFDWFRSTSRSTDAQHSTYIDRPVTAGGYATTWRPYWRFRRHWWAPGWQTWDPWGPAPFVDVHTVTTYEASAEIVMARGDKPSEPDAFDARAVLKSLGPSITRPK